MPLSVIALFALLKLAVPLIVEAPRSIAAFSSNDTFAPVIVKAPKVEDASSKVRSALPLLKVVAPLIAKVPLSVIALFVLLKLAAPLIVEAPRSIAAFSSTDTFAPVIVKAPKVEDAWSKVRSALPLLKVVAPETVSVPLSVMAPATVVAVKVEAESVPRSSALASFSCTPPPVTEVAAWKSLAASVKVTALLPAVMETAPEEVMPPAAWVTAPSAVTVRPATDTFGRMRAASLTKVTEPNPVPVVVRARAPAPVAPVSLLETFDKLRAAPFPLRAKVEPPPTSTFEVPDTLPAVAVTLRSPEAVTAPKLSPVALRSVTSAPDAATVPSKALPALVSEMSPVAVRVVTPSTETAPVVPVMLLVVPAAVTVRAPDPVVAESRVMAPSSVRKLASPPLVVTEVKLTSLRVWRKSMALLVVLPAVPMERLVTVVEVLEASVVRTFGVLVR